MKFLQISIRLFYQLFINIFIQLIFCFCTDIWNKINCIFLFCRYFINWYKWIFMCFLLWFIFFWALNHFNNTFSFCFNFICSIFLKLTSTFVAFHLLRTYFRLRLKLYWLLKNFIDLIVNLLMSFLSIILLLRKERVKWLFL